MGRLKKMAASRLIGDWQTEIEAQTTAKSSGLFRRIRTIRDRAD
jgi:hypothetical protein